MSAYVTLPEPAETVPCMLCARAVLVPVVFGEDAEASVCDRCSAATSYVPAEGVGDAVTLLAAIYGSSTRWDVLAPAFTELADILTGIQTWRDAGLTAAEALAGQPFGWMSADTLKQFADASAADAFQAEAERNKAAAEAVFRSRVAAADPKQMSASDWNQMRRMSHVAAAHEARTSDTADLMSKAVR